MTPKGTRSSPLRPLRRPHPGEGRARAGAFRPADALMRVSALLRRQALRVGVLLGTTGALGLTGCAAARSAGSSLAEISKRAASEARQYNRPVTYQRQTADGWEKVEAVPQPSYGNRCVVVKTYQNGQLVDERMSCD